MATFLQRILPGQRKSPDVEVASRDALLPLIVGLGIFALLFRLLPLSASGALGSFRGYDDGVHYAAAVNLLAGNLPYRDFVLVHPPGIAILLLPFAVLGHLASDNAGIGAARILFVLIGTANTVLVAVLLRRFGFLAVLGGAGLYSVWQATNIAERSIMLSPVLNLFVLAALVCLREGSPGTRRSAVVLSAILLGVALCFKVWAVIPIIVIAVIILVRHGIRELMVYAGAGFATCIVILAPFFVAAPQAMVGQVVQAQLQRTDGATRGLSFRVQHFVGLNLPLTVVSAIFVLGLLMLCLPLAVELRRKSPPRLWSDHFWWSVLALAIIFIFLVSGSFFDQYPNFAAPYIALSLGAVVGRLCLKMPAGSSVVFRTGAAVLILVALLPFADQGALLSPSPLPGVDTGALKSAAAPFNCVWAPYSYMAVMGNTLSRSVAHGCGPAVDLFGSRMVSAAGLPVAQYAPDRDADVDEREAERLLASDAAIVGVPLETYGLTPQLVGVLEESFTLRLTTGNMQLWVRKIP
ncbi:hypothetical protein [Arthrobacter sp.]|uniref:hypothetical protein n=1 Tax=Arthrobacter sp. TaxID=1667 RepID=UPI0026E09727|nr:hypothetical protein [Arthrobacter sp.]MDO5751480.1 hypothetical protein [Arthrobacter sp.]